MKSLLSDREWVLEVYATVFADEDQLHVPIDFMDTCNYVLSTLSEVYRMVALSIWRDKITYKEIAKDLGLHVAQVGRIKTKLLFILSTSYRGESLKLGLEEYRRRKAIRYSGGWNDIAIYDMVEDGNLPASIETYLSCHGIRTLEDIRDYTQSDLLDIKNMGPVAIKKFLSATTKYGFPGLRRRRRMKSA